MADNLWPTNFGDVDRKTPVGILREQGKALGDRTANIVVGRVSTISTVNGKIRHGLALWCSPLGVEVPLLHIDHGIDLYPVELFIAGEPGPSAVLKTEDEFIAKLRELFSRDQTKKTIANLIAQSKQ